MRVPGFTARLGAALFAAMLALAAPNARGELPDPVAFGAAIESGKLSTARKWLDEGLHPDFVADRIDSQPGAPKFNRAVTLRDSRQK